MKSVNISLKETCDSDNYRQYDWDNCCLQYGEQMHERYHRYKITPYLARKAGQDRMRFKKSSSEEISAEFSDEYESSSDYPQNDFANDEIDWKDQVSCESRYGYCDVIKEHQGQKYTNFQKIFEDIIFDFFLVCFF